MGHNPFLNSFSPPSLSQHPVQSADRLWDFLKPAFPFFLAVGYYMDSAVYAMSEFELIFMPIVGFFQS